MNTNAFSMEHETDVAWCPACGNFGILSALKMALAELELDPRKVVMTSGIGQAAKTPQYVNVSFFNGLHGRALPPACGIKASNPELTVIAESGDGDTYGEGGNHFIHAIRRNPDITNIVHNNMIYGLTKGQASPTSQKGLKTPIHHHGVVQEPFNPIAVAVALNASFVARANIGDLMKTKDLMKKAIQHKGYALLDIFQPCTVFNKINTYKWFKENTYYVDDSYDPTARSAAMSKAFETEKFPLGILYVSPSRPTFEENVGVYAKNAAPLYKRRHNDEIIRDLMYESRK